MRHACFVSGKTDFVVYLLAALEGGGRGGFGVDGLDQQAADNDGETGDEGRIHEGFREK